ncbi:MAG: hypothetical protein ABSH14_15620 [Verrucomicrobiia bacterium]
MINEAYRLDAKPVFISTGFVAGMSVWVDRAVSRCQLGVFLSGRTRRQFGYAAGEIPNVICGPLDEFNFVDNRALKSYLDGSKFVEATGFRFTSRRQVMQEFLRNGQRDKHSREQEAQKADKESGCR